MKWQGVAAAVLLAGLTASAGAQSTFSLRNVEAAAEFVYWTAPAVSPTSRLVASLPLAPGGAHRVAPGERVTISLGAGAAVIGTFVPWSPPPQYQTELEGGYLLPQEIPAKGTMLVTRTSWSAANRGRGWKAPLQAWDLVPNTFLPDSAFAEWATIRPLAEWGAGFRPGAVPWPAGWPRLRSLQAAEREGALVVRLVTETGSFPEGVAVSLALRRPGAFLDCPLTGVDAIVWSWVEGSNAVPVGVRAMAGRDLEAWVPWDRLPPEQGQAWRTSPLMWSLIVTQDGVPRTLDVLASAWDQWP